MVIRTDAGTRVLDDDAVDLTPQVVAALDRELTQTREPAPEPQEPQMDEQRLLRMQTCARDVSVGAACADADAGS